jgi:hypothetical protein
MAEINLRKQHMFDKYVYEDGSVRYEYVEQWDEVSTDGTTKMYIRRYPLSNRVQEKIRRYEEIIEEIATRDVKGANSPVPRGRKRKRFLDRVQSFVFKLLDDRGWPEPGKPKWRRQADVVRAVTEFIEHELREEAADSTIKVHTKRLMQEWRDQTKNDN